MLDICLTARKASSYVIIGYGVFIFNIMNANSMKTKRFLRNNMTLESKVKA